VDTATPPVEDEATSEDKYLHIRVKPTPPPAPPIIEGWQVAAAVVPKDRPTGAFVDWFQRPDGSLAIFAGCVTGLGDQPMLAASQLCAAARILGPDGLPANQFIERADNLLWTNSQGDLSAGMLQANLFPGQKNLELAASGPLHALHWVPGRVEMLAQPTRPLGMGNSSAILAQRVPLGEKELIVSYAITETFPERENWAHFVNSELTTVLGSMRKASAERLVELAHETLNRLLNPKRRRDRMVLVLRRS
jgi:serine phosphatase RsbU (regulator of sigma subunit)